MVRFSIEKRSLVSLLHRIFLRGLTYDCVLSAKGDRLLAEGLDLQKAIYFCISVPAEVREEGDVVVGAIELLLQIVGRFSSKLDISVSGSSLVLQEGGKRGSFLLPERNTIDSIRGVDRVDESLARRARRFQTWKFGKNFMVLEPAFARSIVADAGVLDYHRYAFRMAEQPLGSLVAIETKGNSWMISLKDCGQKIDQDLDVVCSFGLKNVLETIEGVHVLFFEPGAPLWIESLARDSFYLLQIEEEEEES